MTDPTAGQPALLTVALRGGENLTLFADYLRGRDETLPLIELVWVGLVPDPAAPLDQPWAVPPALGVRLRDGRQRIYPPADPPDATRMMEAIVARRPDMRMPFPPVPPGLTSWAQPAPPPFPPPMYPPPMYPVPPFAPPPVPPPSGQPAGPASFSASQPSALPPPGFSYSTPGAGPGWAPPPPPPGMGYPPPYGAMPVRSSSSSETLLAGFSHLSVFFAPIILPLIVWLATRQSSPYASYQAKQAFVFHLFFSAIAFVTGIGAYALIFSSLIPFNPGGATNIPSLPFAGFFVLWGALSLLSVVNIVYSIIGAVHAFQGKPFHYPLLGNL